jgi:hypothetical protein
MPKRQADPRQARKAKLKMRFRDRLDEEIAATDEKLAILRELKAEA